MPTFLEDLYHIGCFASSYIHCLETLGLVNFSLHCVKYCESYGANAPARQMRSKARQRAFGFETKTGRVWGWDRGYLASWR